MAFGRHMGMEFNLNIIQMYDFGTFGLKISAGQLN
jgi:hypothetical protein